MTSTNRTEQEQAYIAEPCADAAVLLEAENNAATCPQP